MILSRFVKVQLAIFAVVTVVAVFLMGLRYMQLPSMLGVGVYTVSFELPTTGGIYPTSNVTYRGVTVGRVTRVDLRDGGGVVVEANMQSDYAIPSDLDAAVHSTSAIGEQYIDLIPRSDRGGSLVDGSIVPVERTSVPQDIGPLLDTVDSSLGTLEPGQIQELIGEASTAFEGTGPSIAALLDGASDLTTGFRENLDPLTRLIDNADPVLQSVVDSGDAIAEWSDGIASITGQLREQDQNVRELLVSGYEAADQTNALFQQIKPTVPVLLANLVSIEQVAVTYNPSLEQILVVLPQAIQMEQSITVANEGGTGRGSFAFNLNLNLPEPCTTGFLPASERRDASAVDFPVRTTQPLFCAIPQDDPNAVRGARNLPCMDTPGKRAPSVDICKSDEEYVPVGDNPFIGAPAAVPNTSQSQAGTAAPPNVVAPASDTTGPANSNDVAQANYSTRSGEYLGPDGQTYIQSNLASGATDSTKLDSVLMPTT